MPIQGRAGARFTLFLLTLLYVLNFVDRQLIGILGQPIKLELGLSDKQLGLLTGLAFALFNTLLGVPIARLAERRSRTAIIAWSLGLWSLATAACGMARGLPQLIAARIGVGIGEAGYVPAAQSLIADHWPPQKRATALALFSLGIPVGILIGAVAGGWIAQGFGWRSAFVALGMPGAVLALLIGLFLREPPRGGEDRLPDDDAPPLTAVMRVLWGDAVFRNMALGATLASLAGYGVTGFSVPLLMRAHHLPLAIATTGFGVVVGLGVGIGIAAGGLIADAWTPRRADARALVAAAGTAIGLIGFGVALAGGGPLALALAALPAFIGAHLYFGPVYAATADHVGPRARATAIALLLVAMNGLGLGIGPWLVGALSDHFAATQLAGYALRCTGPAAQQPACLAASATGLAQALRLDILFYVWATVHFLLAARAMRARQPQSSVR